MTQQNDGQRFKIECPFCCTGFRCREKHLGRRVACPQCNHEFRVPKLDLSPEASQRDAPPVERSPLAAPPIERSASSESESVGGFNFNLEESPRPRRKKAGLFEKVAGMGRMGHVIQLVGGIYAVSLAFCLFAYVFGVVSAVGESEVEFSIVGTFLVFVGAGPLILTGMAIFYLFPALIAYLREHRNAVPIAVVTLAFGWTTLGWIGCIAWAFSSDVANSRQTIRQVVVRDDEPRPEPLA